MHAIFKKLQKTAVICQGRFCRVVYYQQYTSVTNP